MLVVTSDGTSAVLCMQICYSDVNAEKLQRNRKAVISIWKAKSRLFRSSPASFLNWIGWMENSPVFRKYFQNIKFMQNVQMGGWRRVLTAGNTANVVDCDRAMCLHNRNFWWAKQIDGWFAFTSERELGYQLQVVNTTKLVEFCVWWPNLLSASKWDWADCRRHTYWLRALQTHTGRIGTAGDVVLLLLFFLSKFYGPPHNSSNALKPKHGYSTFSDDLHIFSLSTASPQTTGFEGIRMSPEIEIRAPGGRCIIFHPL